MPWTRQSESTTPVFGSVDIRVVPMWWRLPPIVAGPFAPARHRTDVDPAQAQATEFVGDVLQSAPNGAFLPHPRPPVDDNAPQAQGIAGSGKRDAAGGTWELLDVHVQHGADDGAG